MGKLKASIFLESGAVSSWRATRFQASLQKERFNKLLDAGNYLFCSKSKHKRFCYEEFCAVKVYRLVI